jgi:hypothetical protein
VISLRQGTLTLLLAAASATTAQPQNLNSLPVACKGERVTRIDIDANPPFRITGDNILARAGQFAAKQHMITRDAVIRRYLALQLGDRCTEVRRQESERILRAQPFIADASVIAYADGNGGIILSVSTVDEVSIILGAGVGGKSGFHSLLLGEDNLMGSAIHLDGSWKRGARFRDIYAGKFVDYQFLGRPYQLRLDGGRRELGSDWATELSHPFLTDLQRISWRTTAGNLNGYYYFRRPDAPAAALKLARSYSDIGGVVRFGPPLGRLLLLGGSISFEDEDPAAEPVVIDDRGIVPDTSQALINRYTKHQTARVNWLWGLRNIHFLRASGFDALEGAQDLRTGVQVATLLGKGVTFLRGNETDWFGSTEVYAGMATPISYAALDIAGEGRRGEEGKWDGILTHGRGALYLKPVNRHTVISDLMWSGGWRQRIPFQLTFGDREGGLRGFRFSDVGGSRRLIGHVEDRYLVGRYRDIASVAVAGFFEAGKIWAGDSPFGVNTPLAASAGVSLLAALPPQSRRTFRVDIAFPVKGERARGWEVRLVTTDFTRIFRVEPRDVFNNREKSVPSSVFNWP